MRWASVLASLNWAIGLISLIQTLHFPVGWISSSGYVGCISKTAFCLIVSPCVVFQVFKGFGVPGYHSWYPLVLVLGTHIQKPFFWDSSIQLIVLLASMSEPRLFLFALALQVRLSKFVIPGVIRDFSSKALSL